jgi:hypothetical protein
LDKRNHCKIEGNVSVYCNYGFLLVRTNILDLPAQILSLLFRFSCMNVHICVQFILFLEKKIKFKSIVREGIYYGFLLILSLVTPRIVKVSEQRA